MEQRRSVVRPGVIGVLLLVLGAVSWGASRLATGIEDHAWSTTALGPDHVRLTRGHSYLLAYPGGVKALVAQGISPSSLECFWQPPGGVRRQLVVQSLPLNTVQRNTVATFVAPMTGLGGISCDGLGQMFVDDSDDARADLAGWLIALATLELVLGVALCLSALRTRIGEVRASEWTAGEDDEVERLVRVVHERSLDDEVVDGDADDRLP